MACGGLCASACGRHGTLGLQALAPADLLPAPAQGTGSGGQHGAPGAEGGQLRDKAAVADWSLEPSHLLWGGVCLWQMEQHLLPIGDGLPEFISWDSEAAV